jgi:serine protease AprX
VLKNIDPIISKFLENDRKEELLAVVIMLKDDRGQVDISQLCSLTDLDRPLHHLGKINQITGQFCHKTLEKLITHPEVKHVHHDYKVRSNLNIATAAVQSKIANDSKG